MSQAVQPAFSPIGRLNLVSVLPVYYSRGVVVALRFRRLLLLGLPSLLATVWAYWSTLSDIVDRWNSDPQYSHGWLVPVFSAYLLYRRRQTIPVDGLTPQWWGLGIIVLGALARAAGFVLYQPWLDSGSLIICLAGLACTLGGRTGWRWAWPAVLFTAFMIPLPFRFQFMLGSNLQSIATYLSTYLLQTVGVPAISEGNVILLTQERLGVVEACSGLSMLVTFFALAIGFAMLIERHWLYAVAMVLAAAPIAVGANVIRITVTGILFEANQNEMAKKVFHDVAGWLMMPLGVAFLALLMVFLDRAFKVRRASA